jgi:type I restriction enzyme S subunit
MSNISPTLLREFPIYVPPIDLQNKFTEIVKQVEKVKTKYKESEKELDNLFGSLMQRAFKGELV